MAILHSRDCHSPAQGASSSVKDVAAACKAPLQAFIHKTHAMPTCVLYECDHDETSRDFVQLQECVERSEYLQTRVEFMMDTGPAFQTQHASVMFGCERANRVKNKR